MACCCCFLFTDLIHSPVLASFPHATLYPDIMDALRVMTYLFGILRGHAERAVVSDTALFIFIILKYLAFVKDVTA